MALTQDERIAISRKLIAIPVENALADQIKLQLEVVRLAAKKRDDSNTKLLNENNTEINGYQEELERQNGSGHTQLAEQDFIDSVGHILQNPFFSNDSNNPFPGVPDGIWKHFVPVSLTKAIGKTNLAAYGSVQKEQDLIDAINTQITLMEGYVDIERSTGLHCVPVDTIQPYVALQVVGTDLIAAVQAWENFITTTFGIIVTTDTDPTRSAQNIASKIDITNAISVIDTWQAIDTYVAYPGVVTCVAFYAYDPLTLNPSKFRAGELDILKAEITARQAFIATRVAQLDANLGTIVYDPLNGRILSATGFFGIRFRYTDLRLNLMSGSLSAVKAAENGQNAQDELKASNDNAELAYSGVLTVTVFKAPAVGTGVIHVKDASGFSVLDSVYIVANEQTEISATISSISGNIVYLDTQIPKNYRQDNGARLYKVL